MSKTEKARNISKAKAKAQKRPKRLPQYTDEKGRDYFFDNAKFLLILFVVVTHSISPMKTDHESARCLWFLFNSFHMPCFVFISGYFSKGYINKDGSPKMQRLFTNILYYLFAQFFMTVFETTVLQDNSVTFSGMIARPGLWYLMCMTIWLLVLPYVVRIKPPIVIVAAFVMGLLVGYDKNAGGFLSLCRVINHFPMFMIGYYFKKEWLFRFRNIWTQLLSVVVIALVPVFAYFNKDIIAQRLLESSYNYKNSYFKIFKEPPVMWINRLLFYVLAIVLCAAFLTLVPRVKTFFTRFGARTLQVYVIQAFIYPCEKKFLWYKLPFFESYGVPKMMVIATAVTFILSLKIFEYPFIGIAKIKLNPLLKKEHQKK